MDADKARYYEELEKHMGAFTQLRPVYTRLSAGTV